MKSKKINFQVILFALSISLLAFGCKKDEDEELLGDWTKQSTLNGTPRSAAASFMIGTKAYVGSGYNGEDRLEDFWVYDISSNSWSQIADMPGNARMDAVGFAIGSKGYVGTGYDGDDHLADFYAYDPSTNEWSDIGEYPGKPVRGAVAFSINNKGYVGTGYNTDFGGTKDFYEFNPSNGEWTLISNYPGEKRRDAAVFVISEKAYLVTGIDNGIYDNQLYVFDPANGTWTEKRKITNAKSDESFDDDYTSIARQNAVAFSVNGKGYLVGGSSSSLVNNVWEYNPGTDLWEEKTAFEGSTRTEAVGWGSGNYGYVTTGRSSSYYLGDIWRFDPTATYDDEN